MSINVVVNFKPQYFCSYRSIAVVVVIPIITVFLWTLLKNRFYVKFVYILLPCHVSSCWLSEYFIHSVEYVYIVLLNLKCLVPVVHYHHQIHRKGYFHMDAMFLYILQIKLPMQKLHIFQIYIKIPTQPQYDQPL